MNKRQSHLQAPQHAPGTIPSWWPNDSDCGCGCDHDGKCDCDDCDDCDQ